MKKWILLLAGVVLAMALVGCSQDILNSVSFFVVL